MMRTGLRVRLLERRRDDRGITTLQVLIMFPIMVIVMFMAIQMALNYYAQEVAMAAAEEGVQVARVTGNPHDGAVAAIAYLQSHGGAFMPGDTHVNTTCSTPAGGPYTQICIEVTGQPMAVIGALANLTTIDQFASGAVERFIHTGSAP
jgi:hypothetical protein